MLTLLLAIVRPAGELPPWLMFAAGAVLFGCGLVIFFGGRAHDD